VTLVRVLLIDDAAVLRAAFARIVASLGHDVTALGDPAQGLRRAAQERFAAIVVDGRLEGWDATEYVAAVHAAAPQAAIFIIASLDERPLVVQAAAAGATGAVLRPFRRSQIRDAFAPLAPLLPKGAS